MRKNNLEFVEVFTDKATETIDSGSHHQLLRRCNSNNSNRSLKNINSNSRNMDSLELESPNPVETPNPEENLDWFTKKFAIKAGLIAGIGGLLFGYDIGVISGALKLLEKDFDLTKLELELVVSLMTAGAVIGAAFGGAMCDKIGRKTTILITNVIFVAAGLTLFFAPNLAVIYVGRVVLGVGIAVSAISDIAYLNEVSPPSIRGALVSSNELMITLGVLFSYLVDYALRSIPEGWRYEFGAAAVLSILQAIGMIRMPRSPRWLVSQGQRHDAIEAMLHIYPTKRQAEHQILAIEHLQQKAQMATGTTRESFSEWKHQFILVAFLMFFQQFSGHSNILNYAEEVFSRGGMSSEYAALALIMLGVVKVVGTAFSLVIVDRCGRKRLLLGGVTVMLISLALLAAAFSLHDGQPVIVLIASCVIVAAYAFSFGPITWIITSELFPTSIKGRAIGFGLVSNWLGNFIVATTFLTLMEAFGEIATFSVHAACCLLAVLFIAIAIPETKGKGPEEIAAQINGSKRRRSAKDRKNALNSKGVIDLFDTREQTMI